MHSFETRPTSSKRAEGEVRGEEEGRRRGEEGKGREGAGGAGGAGAGMTGRNPKFPVPKVNSPNTTAVSISSKISSAFRNSSIHSPAVSAKRDTIIAGV